MSAARVHRATVGHYMHTAHACVSLNLSGISIGETYGCVDGIPSVVCVLCVYLTYVMGVCVPWV